MSSGNANFAVWIESEHDRRNLDDASEGAPERNTKHSKKKLGPTSPAIAATPFAWRDPATIPRRRFVYGRHFIRQFVSTTVAPGGVGKSSLGIVEALAMVSGKALLGITPERRLKVWLWNGEDPAEEMWRRVMAAALHYSLREADLEGLFINSGRSMPIVIGHQTGQGVVIAVPVVEAVKEAIREKDIDVLIVDPFVSSHQVSENDNNAIERVAKTWAAIADATRCAIDLVHHTRKTGGGEAMVEDGRGASSLHSAVRSARVLNAMTRDEAQRANVENRRLYFRVNNGKANLAPPSDESEWFELSSVELGNGDQVGVVSRWQWPDPLDDITIDHLRAAQKAVNEGGQWRESSQAKQWVGIPIAGALGLDLKNKAHKKKVSALLKVWFETGMFVRVPGKDAKRMEKIFVEVGRCATD